MVCHIKFRAAAVALAAALFAGCENKPSDTPARPAPEAAWFADLAAPAGLNFVTSTGCRASFYFPEIMGPGVALFDYDNDGDLDVFIVQGQMLGERRRSDAALSRRRHALPLKGRLFRNDLRLMPTARATPSFTDVTDASGIDARGYGMGVAAGDFDNDGCVDLYVTNARTEPAVPQQLRRHVHRRVEARAARTTPAGACRPRSSTTTATAGWICSSATTCTTASRANTQCFGMAGGPDYCPPHVVPPQPSRLLSQQRRRHVHRRHGRRRHGRASSARRSASSTADFNGDGWIDIYVANDGEANQLWINQRDGTFRNTALARRRRA